MANALIVHDDSVISRVAYLIEKRKRNIRRYEAILSGKDENYENYHVNPEAVKQALETERWMLSDLIEDVQDGMFDRELRDTESAYCREGGNDGEQV